MSRITGVVVALATTAAVLSTASSGASSGAAPPAPAAAAPATELPREIPRGTELTMPDGDLLRLWAGRSTKVVWAKRYDTAAGAWGPRAEVLRRPNLFCGEVEARTANGAVAVLAQCDRGGYAEDQAPVSSRALWSPDGVTWTSYQLEGEAYEEPGISPDGLKAVWPLHEGYATRTPAGYATHRLSTPGQEYTITATITDAEQVSVLYGASTDRGCALVVLTRTSEATPTRQDLPLGNGCADTGLTNVDVDTVWSGDPASPANRSVITRPDPTSPWTVRSIAPVDAPGLVHTWRKLDQRFFTAPGLPLFALGSTDRRIVLGQAYDPVAQSWSPPVTLYDAGRLCQWGDTWTSESISVLTAELTCDRGRHVVLTTSDGTSWQAVQGSRVPRGVSADGRYVVVPGRTRTHVISRERGVVTLPGGVSGRCDVALPDGPDEAVLLTSAGRHRGWPTVLQHSSPQGWSRLSKTQLPTPKDACRSAQASYLTLDSFDIGSGTGEGYTVRLVQRGGAWKAQRIRW